MGPSGNFYRIRPMNMERYALAGGLPATLRQLAMKGAEGVNEVLSGESDIINEHGDEVRSYIDSLVRQVIVEPDLTDADLDVLPPVDYRWAVNVAMGEEDRDGEGRKLWGREPLSVWATFRNEHECAEDCASCQRMVTSVADAQRGSGD